MEPRLRMKKSQGTLGFRSTKKLLPKQEPYLNADGKEHRPPAQLQHKGPQIWPPAGGKEVSKKDQKGKLPERLLLLEELYHSMEAAISLLRIRHHICTFSTIAAAVESSTQRRFLKSHLAQMKHILPEALQLEEHFTWDAESQSSRKDLRITLLPIPKGQVVPGSKRDKSPHRSSDMVVRRQEFHRRLLEFHQTDYIHMDVPEASLLDQATASSQTVDNSDPVDPQHKFGHGHQVERDGSQTEKQIRATGHGYDELADAGVEDSCNEESTSPALPIAFDMSLLKKYPRSPSTLPQQLRVPAKPHHSSMSHLPAVFRRHFSAKGCPASSVSNCGHPSGIALEPESLLDSAPPIKPHSSLRSCKKIVEAPMSCTPLKGPGHPTIPIENDPDHTAKLPLQQVTSSQVFSPAPPSMASTSPCKTPAQQEVCSIITSPQTCTPISTPHQAICTPLASTMRITSVPTKECPDVPGKRRKQAVIKSLKFGTPTKLSAFENSRLSMEATEPTSSNHDEVCQVPATTPAKEATPSMRGVDANQLSFVSPVRTPATDTFIIPKRGTGNVSRVLPFGSPACEKNKEAPQEETAHTPKRVKLQICEPQSNTIKQDPSNTESMHVQLETLETYASTEGGVKVTEKLSVSDMEILKCLPQSLIEDVQAKERKQIQDVQSGVEKARRRQQLIAGLPRLFNMVRLIFQSGKRTVLTHKELVKTVLSSHPDITDQGEILEQLQLLVELACDWISTSLSSTGDWLYRINKNADMRTVSKVLTQAKERFVQL